MKPEAAGNKYRASNGRFQCDVCSCSYRNFKHLKRHLLHHTGVRPFPCDLCDARFARKDCMQRHRMSCLKKPLVARTAASSILRSSSKQNSPKLAHSAALRTTSRAPLKASPKSTLRSSLRSPLEAQTEAMPASGISIGEDSTSPTGHSSTSPLAPAPISAHVPSDPGTKTGRAQAIGPELNSASDSQPSGLAASSQAPSLSVISKPRRVSANLWTAVGIESLSQDMSQDEEDSSENHGYPSGCSGSVEPSVMSVASLACGVYGNGRGTMPNRNIAGEQGFDTWTGYSDIDYIEQSLSAMTQSRYLN